MGKLNNKNNIMDTLMFLSIIANLSSIGGNIIGYIMDKPKLQLLCVLGSIISFPCFVATSIPDIKKALRQQRD